MADFRHRVLSVVRRIPPGNVATYGDVAALAGRPRAWRAVGTIMRTCRDSRVPCHRVVAAGGRLGGYGGSEAVKGALLRAEGLTVIGSRIRRFAAARWTTPQATRRRSEQPRRRCRPAARTSMTANRRRGPAV